MSSWIKIELFIYIKLNKFHLFNLTNDNDLITKYYSQNSKIKLPVHV